jgi:hypothetical protein
MLRLATYRAILSKIKRVIRGFYRPRSPNCTQISVGEPALKCDPKLGDVIKLPSAKLYDLEYAVAS